MKLLAICGEHPEVLRKLNMMGINAIVIGESSVLQKPVARHADMLCVKTGASSGYCYDDIVIEKLCKYGIHLIKPSAALGTNYPYDIRLNCLHIGNLLLGNIKYLSPEIVRDAEEHNLSIVDVKQGYAKCSVAVVNDSAAITADEGIYKALTQHGIDTLKIRPGYIDIEQYPYGFIGGSCITLGNKVLFCGDPLYHPDGNAIVSFINSHGARVVTTGNHALHDFGSAVIFEL